MALSVVVPQSYQTNTAASSGNPARDAVTGDAVSKPVAIHKVRGGWAALGDGWAVHAPTRSDALRRYNEVEARNAIIDARPIDTAAEHASADTVDGTDERLYVQPE